MTELKKRMRWLFALSHHPDDPREVKAKKSLQASLAYGSIPMIFIFVGLFLVNDRNDLNLYPLTYLVGTIVLLAHLSITKRWRLFREGHLVLVLILPFLLQWQMGGFYASGAFCLWGSVAPNSSLIFMGPRRSAWWFITYVLLLIAAPIVEGQLNTSAPILPADQIGWLFTLNLVGVGAFSFIASNYWASRVQAEREKSKNLLLNVLPSTIARRLKAGENTIADRFEEVTVIFTDLVGFTTLSADMKPSKVVELLNDIFIAFDEIVEYHNLEKIKTIGDAYMAVAGLPEPLEGHAVAACAAAKEMSTAFARLCEESNLDLSMRIGVHSGPVVAGVIGKKKFSYDLWGDTVNTANRMESHGLPGRVHISKATRAHLGDSFNVEPRGEIAVRGKGKMETFLLKQ